MAYDDKTYNNPYKQHNMKRERSTTGIVTSASVVLTIVFVALKLTKVIAWSWWWVFSPVLIELGIALAAIILLAVILLTNDEYEGEI